MKNIIKKVFGIIVLLVVPVVLTMSQPPAPENNGTVVPSLGGSGTTLNCPVGNGYWILLGLAVGYAIYKVLQMRKAEKLA